MRPVWRTAIAAAMACLLAGSAGAQPALKETPSLAADVGAGKLPPVAERAPKEPLVVQIGAPRAGSPIKFEGNPREPGKPGGELRAIIGRPQDIRLLVVYGYARLIGWDENFELKPDILSRYEVQDGRIFTFHLRPGHRWSNGEPFTAEDFRYWWEDVANNKQLSPGGPPRVMRVDEQLPKFEVLDARTVRFTWEKPNPFFLAEIAGTSPLYTYRPSAFLKQYHGKYAEKAKLDTLVAEAKQRNWAALHNRIDNMYRNDNPDLPTLDPWVNTTRPPTVRFVAHRNPYFHRVDQNGVQLPYIDRVVLLEANTKLIALKASGGESDLQARGLAFNNYTFLKEAEDKSGYDTRLWKTVKGAQVALMPNLNVADSVWRDLIRDVRFRRALSLGIDRKLINQVIYFGLAAEGNNTVLAGSPLYREEYRTRWAAYDKKQAGKLLDEIGLTKRDSEGFRLLPDGRRMEIIVETAGEDTEQTDVLELIRETWGEIGVKLFSKPSQREVFRNRAFSGAALMTVWTGLENGVPTPDMSPAELAPVTQQSLQWPKWGQYYESMGRAGEAPDVPEAQELFRLNDAWNQATDGAQRTAIWHQMLKIHAEQVFTIGIVAGVPQPVLVSRQLRNVPSGALFNWEPGAQFGIYRPDTFWFANAR
jgi:peptide/nickel transport system substrate-binding protein